MLVRLKLEQSQVVLHSKGFDSDHKVFVDKGQIQQVLLNLILNAIEVMPRGGGLFIDLSIMDRCVVVLIRDEGVGIPEELRERIFDSFLTGKRGEWSWLDHFKAHHASSRWRFGINKNRSIRHNISPKTATQFMNNTG